jgi:aryl-alcohol dehydrogenase-like predicted oxidoreductase
MTGSARNPESIAIIHAAHEAGITMLDTGDFYGMGQNEMLIREALKGGKRERAFIEVKLTPGDLARIEQALPENAVAGARYLPAVLAHMDSEHAG